MNRRRSIGVFVLLAGLMLATPAVAEESISIGYLRASSAAPIMVMQQQKIAQKHGLDLQAKEFLDLGAMDRAFVLGEFDVHSSLSLNTWGTYLNRGHDFVGILGTLYPHTAIIVPKDSPFKTLNDLRDKRVGVYGIHGTSTAMFGVIASERFGINIRKDMKLFGSVPPVLPTLLAKGEVDAILNLPPFVQRMIASGDYRVLVNIAEEWEKLQGHGLPFTVMAVARKTMQARSDATRRLVAAWREAVDYLRDHPEALDPFLATAKITEPAAVKFAHQTMIPQFMKTWTEKDVENVRTYWKIAARTGFMEKPVQAQNWYTFEFVR